MKKMRLILALTSILHLFANGAFAQRSYLMIVDVQKSFYENTDYENEANEMVVNINQLIGNTDPQKVIYIQATGKVLSISFRGIKALPMTTAPDLDTNLLIVSNNLFIKTEGDAFSVADLRDFLEENDVEEIIIVGLLAEKCVYDSAIGGKERGYDIYIVPEAITSKSIQKKEKTLAKMTKKGVEVLHLSEIIDL